MENCCEESPQSSQDYYPHYNLFKSSIFYDTDNFLISYLTNLTYGFEDCIRTESGTKCAKNEKRSAEPPDKPPDDEKTPPEDNEYNSPVSESEEKPRTKLRTQCAKNEKRSAEPPGKPPDDEKTPPEDNEDNSPVSESEEKPRTKSRTQCAKNENRSAEPPDKLPHDEKTPLEDNEDNSPASESEEKPFVTKEELYQNPDLFRSKNLDVQSNSPKEPAYFARSEPWGYDWTRQSWVKGGGKRVVMSKKEERKEEWRSKQKLYKQLADAPAIKSSKAENMMQKMGWTGGALGKSSDGILDPVTPDPVYASKRTVGFGQRTKKQPKVPGKKYVKRDFFRTNVLLYVLEFVQDDTEIELSFDTSLKQIERRNIRSLVKSVINDGNVMGLSSVAQYDLVADIQKCNQYELGTHSDGEVHCRQISIYKEAPEHVYLVTPDDFLPKDDNSTDEDEEQTSYNTNKENETFKNVWNNVQNDVTIANYKSENDESKKHDPMEMDDDENPFLKSIKKSLKRDDEPKNITKKIEKDCSIEESFKTEPVLENPKDKILEFFVEFAETEDYQQLWFLGKFTAEQIEVINDLLNDIATCIEDVDRFEGDEEISKIFKSGATFELKEGCNGTTEIHKVPALQSE